MRGIDISHWNGWPFKATTKQGYKESDFVIVKATQGVSYSYITYFAKAMAKANADKKLLGAYHYAAGGDPVAEADYFVSVVKPYIGSAILALDWEKGGNRAWGSTTWARKFVDRVHSKAGVWPLIYTGTEGVKHCASCASDCALWFAGYPLNANSWTCPSWPRRYSIKPWSAYVIWQFTSGAGKLDRNTSPMSADRWKELAGAKKAAKTFKKTATISKNTYSGEFPELPSRGYYKYGDGFKTLITKRGEIKKLQKLINWIACEKIAVDGKYGAYTELAVRDAQKVMGLKSDGLFGPATLAGAKLFKQ